VGGFEKNPYQDQDELKTETRSQPDEMPKRKHTSKSPQNQQYKDPQEIVGNPASRTRSRTREAERSRDSVLVIEDLEAKTQMKVSINPIPEIAGHRNKLRLKPPNR